MVKVMAILQIDEEVLRYVYEEPGKEYSMGYAFMREMGLAHQHGVTLESFKVVGKDD